jgi:hypothetical protein
VLLQVGGYLGYSGRDADIVAEAASDPKESHNNNCFTFVDLEAQQRGDATISDSVNVAAVLRKPHFSKQSVRGQTTANVVHGKLYCLMGLSPGPIEKPWTMT